MGFLPKELLFKAYVTLSDLTENHLQGQTQKVSALRHLFALDMFYKKYSGNCDLNISDNKSIYTSFVKKIVGLDADQYVVDFYKNIKKLDDCGVSSNFYSVGVVKNSIENTSYLYSYPTRGSFPLFNVQNNVLIWNAEYIKNIYQYLNTENFRAAFIIWLLREEPLISLEIETIINKLKSIFSDELVEFAMPKPDNLTSYIDGFNLVLEKSIMSKEEILSLFAHKVTSHNNSFPAQQIYFGAPGTGKSFVIDGIVNKDNSVRTTFHPDSDYSTFVGCYKPSKATIKINNSNVSLEKLIAMAKDINNRHSRDKVKHIIDFVSNYSSVLCDISNSSERSLNDLIKNELHFVNDTYLCEVIYKANEFKRTAGEITYDFVPQAFTTAYINAWKNLEEPYYLVIEEINRGNCAQIFGDIFQLLDRDSETGYSSYKITPDKDLQCYLSSQLKDYDIDEDIKSGEKMLLPRNLNILATMNTSDQSLFPIDSAFKRRWDWKYIPIDYSDNGHYIACGSDKFKWNAFLETVNARIESVTQSEDKKMGSWFVKPNGKEISADKFVSKVIFYLWNDVFKDFCHDGSTIFKEDFNKFHKFFDFKGDVKLDILKKFLVSLGLTPISQESQNTELAEEVQS